MKADRDLNFALMDKKEDEIMLIFKNTSGYGRRTFVLLLLFLLTFTVSCDGSTISDKDDADKPETQDVENTRSEEFIYISNRDGTCSIAGLRGETDGNITIPPLSPDGDMVVEILHEAFRDNREIRAVVLSDTVAKIGSYAFFGCENLKEISFSKSLETIDEYAFELTGLESVTIPTSMKIIGRGAFCKSELSEVVIENGVRTICTAAFATTKIQEITIPRSVELIEHGAFNNCTSLNNINVDVENENYRSASGNLIDKRSNMLIAVSGSALLPESDGIITMGEDAFCGREIMNVEIPSGTEYIETHAFRLCVYLSEISIPNTVKVIETSAFYSCIDLRSIRYEGTVSEWESIDKSEGWDMGVGEYTVYCTDGNIDKNS